MAGRRDNGEGCVKKLPSGSYHWQVTLGFDERGKQLLRFWQLNDKQAELPKGQPKRQAAPCTTSLQTRMAALRWLRRLGAGTVDGSSGVLVEVRDADVQGKELLGPSSTFEAQLLPFLLSGWTVRLFDQVVTPCSRGDLDVLHSVEHEQFPDSRPVAPEFVGVNDPGNLVLTEQPGEEGAGSLRVPVRLEQEIEQRAMRLQRATVSV